MIEPLFDHRNADSYNAGMVRGSWILAVMMIAAGDSFAQVIHQQSVQLPTFHYFGVQTTVVVPAQGTIPLGSVTRAGQRRTRFDRVGSSFGTTIDTGGLSMGVTVIDHHELDRRLLAEAARRRGANVDVLGRTVEKDLGVPQPLHPPILSPPREKVAAEVYLRRGRNAELAGQTEIAKVFYRRAAKLGNAVEKRAAEDRLALLQADPPP